MPWRSLAWVLLGLSACADVHPKSAAVPPAQVAPEEAEPEAVEPAEPVPDDLGVDAAVPGPTALGPGATVSIGPLFPQGEPGALLFASSAADAGTGEADAAPSVSISEPTTVLVVLDQSGSMGQSWSGGQTRWVAANRALMGALEPIQAQLTIGAILFPLPGNCSVEPIGAEGQYPFQAGPLFIERWKQTIRIAAPSGSTPLERALSAADAALTGAGELLQQRTMVIVITDGEPTCDDDLEALERLPATWLERGIATHVMGLPGSEGAAQLLDRIARAGGSDKYTPIGTPDKLTAEVAAVLASVRLGE